MIFVNKGIEIGSNALTLEIIADTCGPEIAKAAAFIVRYIKISHLYTTEHTHLHASQSGPSFAKESEPNVLLRPCRHTQLNSLVVDRQPTSVSVASFTETEADKASVLFHQPHFRW